MCRVYSTILMVETEDKARGLQELPVRLLRMNTGRQAVQCLRREKVDTVISRWDLVDMPDGLLLKRILAARPKMPTIALIQAGSQRQEILARSLGVTAIVSEDVDSSFFRRLICEILHIEDFAAMTMPAMTGAD